MLVTELEVEIRRRLSRGVPYCLCDILGKGYSVAGELATGEPKVPCDDPGRIGEDISSYAVALAYGEASLLAQQTRSQRARGVRYRRLERVRLHHGRLLRTDRFYIVAAYGGQRSRKPQVRFGESRLGQGSSGSRGRLND